MNKLTQNLEFESQLIIASLDQFYKPNGTIR